MIRFNYNWRLALVCITLLAAWHGVAWVWGRW